MAGATRRVRLSDDTWRHIVENHREVQEWKSRVSETVMDPDVLAVGEGGELLGFEAVRVRATRRKVPLCPFRELEGVAFYYHRIRNRY